jgi:hypothetical protein
VDFSLFRSCMEMNAAFWSASRNKLRTIFAFFVLFRSLLVEYLGLSCMYLKALNGLLAFLARIITSLVLHYLLLIRLCGVLVYDFEILYALLRKLILLLYI